MQYFVILKYGGIVESTKDASEAFLGVNYVKDCFHLEHNLYDYCGLVLRPKLSCCLTSSLKEDRSLSTYVDHTREDLILSTCEAVSVFWFRTVLSSYALF